MPKNPRVADKILPGLLAFLPLCLGAAERPYFVTYDHELEEPGNLEVSINPVLGVPKQPTSSSARGRNSSTVSKAGGRPNSISTPRRRRVTAPSLRASVGKTASGR